MLGLADCSLVPGRDIAMFGFESIPEAALYQPELTTIAIAAREIGEEAVHLLLRRIAAPNGAPESIILPPKLVVRSSCGGKSRGIPRGEVPAPCSITNGTRRRKGR